MSEKSPGSQRKRSRRTPSLRAALAAMGVLAGASHTPGQAQGASELAGYVRGEPRAQVAPVSANEYTGHTAMPQELRTEIEKYPWFAVSKAASIVQYDEGAALITRGIASNPDPQWIESLFQEGLRETRVRIIVEELRAQTESDVGKYLNFFAQSPYRRALAHYLLRRQTYPYYAHLIDDPIFAIAERIPFAAALPLVGAREQGEEIKDATGERWKGTFPSSSPVAHADALYTIASYLYERKHEPTPEAVALAVREVEEGRRRWSGERIHKERAIEYIAGVDADDKTAFLDWDALKAVRGMSGRTYPLSTTLVNDLAAKKHMHERILARTKEAKLFVFNMHGSPTHMSFGHDPMSTGQRVAKDVPLLTPEELVRMYETRARDRKGAPDIFAFLQCYSGDFVRAFTALLEKKQFPPVVIFASTTPGQVSSFTPRGRSGSSVHPAFRALVGTSEMHSVGDVLKADTGPDAPRHVNPAIIVPDKNGKYLRISGVLLPGYAPIA